MSTDKGTPATATDTNLPSTPRRVSRRGKIMCLLLALFLLAGHTSIETTMLYNEAAQLMAPAGAAFDDVKRDAAPWGVLTQIV